MLTPVHVNASLFIEFDTSTITVLLNRYQFVYIKFRHVFPVFQIGKKMKLYRILSLPLYFLITNFVNNLCY
jgi:hypothetical protein